MAKAPSIPAATILFDRDALAALQGEDVAPLLKQVAELLKEVRDRLDGELKPVLDSEGVEELTGLSERTLRTHHCPCRMVGGQKRYLRHEVLEWIAARPLRTDALMEASG
jgi:hypothetical protein